MLAQTPRVGGPASSRTVGAVQHGRTEIDSDDAARWPNPPSGNEAGETGAETQVEARQSLTKLGLKGNRRDTGEGFHRFIRNTGQQFLWIAQIAGKGWKWMLGVGRISCGRIGYSNALPQFVRICSHGS